MRAIAVVACASALAGCLIDDGEPSCDRVPTPVDADGTLTGYVVDRLDLPNDSDEVASLGLDIDYWRDGGQGLVDNQLGAAISIFSWFDYDIDAEANAMIDSGVLLHLLDVQATSLANARGVGMRIGLGLDLDADPTDNFTGTEPLEYDPAYGSGQVTGDLVDGHFRGLMGETRIGVAFPGMTEPFILPLIETQVDATITPTEITGRLGGGVPIEFVDQTLVPVLYEGIGRVIARDCPDGTCMPGSSGAEIMSILDGNGDGTLTLTEFRDDPLVQGFLMPDLVLRGPSGAPENQCTFDDTYDAISIGVGFHAVRAAIQ